MDEQFGIVRANRGKPVWRPGFMAMFFLIVTSGIFAAAIFFALRGRG